MAQSIFCQGLFTPWCRAERSYGTRMLLIKKGRCRNAAATFKSHLTVRYDRLSTQIAGQRIRSATEEPVGDEDDIRDVVLFIGIDIGFFEARWLGTTTEEVLHHVGEVTDIDDFIGAAVNVAANVDTAAFAGIPYTVFVLIGLIGIVDVHAVIADITNGVVIHIRLVGVGVFRTVVADITDIIGVDIGLIGVRRGEAVVADITHFIAIAISLVGVGVRGAVVADITDIIAVRIILARVE